MERFMGPTYTRHVNGDKRHDKDWIGIDYFERVPYDPNWHINVQANQQQYQRFIESRTSEERKAEMKTQKE
jgi:hypothetical protein